jgi:hypothetical protein
MPPPENPPEKPRLDEGAPKPPPPEKLRPAVDGALRGALKLPPDGAADMLRPPDEGA